MFIVHCSCSLFIVPTVLLSSLMIFFFITGSHLNKESCPVCSGGKDDFSWFDSVPRSGSRHVEPGLLHGLYLPFCNRVNQNLVFAEKLHGLGNKTSPSLDQLSPHHQICILNKTELAATPRVSGVGQWLMQHS